MNVFLCALCFAAACLGAVFGVLLIFAFGKARIPVHVDLVCRRHGCAVCGPLPIDVRCS